MGKIIGIDLGTTTSEIAYINNGKPELITNNLGSRITPSVVGLSDDNEVIVGITAKRQAVLKPERTIMEVKRLMGSTQKVSMGDTMYRPQEISAVLLKNLKKYAEDFLGEEVTEAVITVPANFNDLQRQATKEAGELAGFKVERIINEPTAAALAYGINNLQTEEKVLVYDLGGGTFDVTVLELVDGILEVRASRGNNELGGKDFDERIENYIVEDFYGKYGIDLKGNPMAMARIKEAAENAKIELSTMEVTEITIPFVAIDDNRNPLAVNMKLTRAKFEELIKDLIEATEKEVSEALSAAEYTEKDIDVVLAVGGSSRVPCVRNLLSNKFNKKIKTDVNPDEAVALGAAVQAGIKNDEISSEDGIIIIDACRYTLGTSIVTSVGDRMMDGIFDPIILRDSKIPCTESKIYGTVSDNQTEVEVEVYEGDGPLVIQNTKIGNFLLQGIPPAPAGEQQIEISFSYNLNGILEVCAKILSTGKSVSKIIDTLNNSESNVNSFENINLEQWKNCRLASQIEFIVECCEKKAAGMSVDDKNKIETLLNNLKKAVINDDEETVKSLDEELTELLFEL